MSAVRVVATWADGHGVWHARVTAPTDLGKAATALRRCRRAIRDALQARYRNVDPACWTALERVPDLDDDATIVYREGSPTA